MDYEQDYSKLSANEPHWYDNAKASQAEMKQQSQASSEATAAAAVNALDNEDFN